MSGKGFELDSNFLPNKKKRISEVDDRISQLPDDIIVHILSFLPLKKAAATSILSRRWLHLWKYTPNLIFVNGSLEPMINMPVSLPTQSRRKTKADNWILLRSLKNMAWVNSALGSYRASSLKQFEISFHVHEDFYSQDLTKWLHFAFSRRVESLKLDFACSPAALNANILRTSMESSGGKLLFLRELRVERLSLSGGAIEWFLHNCPLLEVLIINPEVLMSDLVVIGGRLKHLEVQSGTSGMCTTVSAPNLTRLRYRCDIGKLFLKNVSNLIEASCDLYGSLDALRHLTNAAPRLETLTIALNRPLALPAPQMLKLNKLVKLAVDYKALNKNFLLPITYFLQASPCLQEFRLKISNHFYHSGFSFENGTFNGGIFELPQAIGSPHHHLKVFEFSGFCCDAADHVELMSYIVDKCVALEKILTIPISAAIGYEREISPGVVLPAPYLPNPYVVKVGLAYDPNPFAQLVVNRDVILSGERDASLKIKRWTEQLLTGKVPRHINLAIL